MTGKITDIKNTNWNDDTTPPKKIIIHHISTFCWIIENGIMGGEVENGRLEYGEREGDGTRPRRENRMWRLGEKTEAMKGKLIKKRQVISEGTVFIATFVDYKPCISSGFPLSMAWIPLREKFQYIFRTKLIYPYS